MAFDWDKLEREERRGHDRVALTLGIVFTLGGAVGIVWNLAIPRPALVTGSVVWFLLGLGALTIGLRARRRHPAGSEQQGGRAEHGDGRPDGVQPPPA